jgi:hypothetical protein
MRVLGLRFAAGNGNFLPINKNFSNGAAVIDPEDIYP